MGSSVNHVEILWCDAWMFAKDVVALCSEHEKELPENDFLRPMLKVAEEKLRQSHACLSCMASNDVDARFCKKCGVAMRGASDETLRMSIDPKKFWWSGVGSDNTNLIRRFADKIHGRIDMIFHWEGYGPSGLRIQDGHVVDCEVVMTLEPRTGG